MTTTAGRLVLLPLDDRPVNVLLPADVARVAGVELVVPPRTLLPDYRRAGDADALVAWLEEQAADPRTGELVVSLDMLGYGGLIASRISADDTATVLGRLESLRRIARDRHGLPISAVSLVMRASNSDSAAEEPDYWAHHGRAMHAFGADLHRAFLDTHAEDRMSPAGVALDDVDDFARRRLRNHIVNLAALGLADEGTLSFLAMTADDTASFSIGSVEQLWMRHWQRFLPHADRTLMYPGADEVGSVLVARALARSAGIRPAFAVACADAEGLERIPLFENRGLRESIGRQLLASGAVPTDDASAADIVLVVHAPDPDRHDMTRGAPPVGDPEAAHATARLVLEHLDAGRRVALADVRFANGADRLLLDELAAATALGRLSAFGAWNTAGNTLGVVVATASAEVVGRHRGTFDSRASRRALVTRLLDDWAYQAVVRTEVGPSLFPDRLPMDDNAAVAHAEEQIAAHLTAAAADVLEPSDGFSGIRLPWRRSFEIEIAFDGG